MARLLTMVLALGVVLGACSAPAGAPEPAPRADPSGAPEWRTDFERLADGVRLADFVRATPGRDTIPALDDPAVVPVSEVDWIGPDEPVIAVEAGGAWRAYPLQVLLWHEIANDVLGGEPLAVTFCPLCHTAVVFDRRLDGTLLDFGVTGFLRRSDLVMYDRQTETWWQQATGVGLVGVHAGAHLRILPSSLVAWSAFATAHPDATVLDRDTGHDRPYGRNPYPGWDRIDRNPLLGDSQPEPCDGAPGCIDPKERVGVVTLGGSTVVYRFAEIAAAGNLVHDRIGRTPVVVWWLPDVRSVLNHELLERGDQVGTLVAFDRRLRGERLEFRLDGGELVDVATGSRWNALGEAEAGEHRGARLERLTLDTPYWVGFAAFGANYRIWEPAESDG